jgi:two-component system, OmpR family, phosphate regulon sensor histidine kinase PhoR
VRRPRTSLRARIALTAIAASGSALIAVPLLVGPQLRQNYIEQSQQALQAEARLMAQVVLEPMERGATISELDTLVDDASREIRARATIVAPDGRVLADSAVSGYDALLALENHSERPEIVQALRDGAGRAVRMSRTVDRELVYAAVPIRSGGRVLGVSRVALSMDGVESQVSKLRGAIALSLALAFAIAVLLSAPLSSSVIGPLRDVMEVARRFAQGELGARIDVRSEDELGELGRIINDTAQELQARLAESQRDRARTEAMLSAMEEGVLAVDHEERVLVANDALRRWFDLESPAGRHYRETFHLRQVEEVIEGVLQQGTRASRELELTSTGRVLALTGVPFPDTEGKPKGAVLTFHDISARRQGDKVRRDFVANASHELRTPLTSIRGFVEALEDGAIHDPQTAARFLGKIRTHADRMAVLVEDLLELSRLESGDRPPDWEEVSPNQLVEEVLTSFSGRAARKSLILSRSGPGAPVVVTDAERLMRILENLVDNAVKYTPAGGHVEIYAGSADGDSETALVEVRDDGAGISPEHLSRLFERFDRGDKARSRDLGGTGLGLSIVRHLAEGMGASVKVTSEVGKGSCFSVSLPREPAPESDGPPVRRRVEDA